MSEFTALKRARSDENVAAVSVGFDEVALREDVYYAAKGKPSSATKVTEHINNLKRHAAELHDAQRRVRELTDKTSALSLLEEVVNLAALGDIDEHTEAYGWGDWMKRANACLLGAGALTNEPVSAPHAQPEWNFYGLPRTKLVGRGAPFADSPVYYWRGRPDRASAASVRWGIGSLPQLPVGADHVIVDRSRGNPSDTCDAFVCRILECAEPLSLGHTVVIARDELTPVGDDWKPIPQREPEVLSGCAVRAAIQRDPTEYERTGRAADRTLNEIDQTDGRVEPDGGATDGNT